MTDDRSLSVTMHIRSRRLPYLAASGLLLVPLIGLLAFRRDLMVEFGLLPWLGVTMGVCAAFALALLKLMRPAPLLRISPDGIYVPGLLDEPLRWCDIRRVENDVRRGLLGDLQDRLIVHLKQPREFTWRRGKARRMFGGLPHAVVAVDIGFRWPIRAGTVRERIRAAAQSFARAPTLQSDAPARPTSRHPLQASVFVFVLALLPIGFNTADFGLPRQFSDGLALYRAGETKAAVSYLTRDARAGDAEAATALGTLYLNGDGVERNPSMAAGWFRRAAEAGHAEAAYHLGDALRLGVGLPVDVAAAISWYKRAADRGAPEAAYALARMYRLGDNVRRDYTQAIKWLRAAADQEFAPAEHDLGQLYHAGIAVPRDTKQAAEWYLSAAERGHVPSRYELARLLLDSEPGMRRQAMQMLETAAQAGHAPAQRRLSALFASGTGTERDPIEAYKWISLAERAWPAATRADLVREKARIAQQMSPADMDRAKASIRAWKPLR